MSQIGCSKNAIGYILGGQLLIVLAISALIVALLTILTDAFGSELVRLFVL